MKRLVIHLILLGAATTWTALPSAAGETKHGEEPKLQISINDLGQVVIIWNGKAELAEARGKNGAFKRVHKSKSPYVVTPTEEQASFRLESENSSSSPPYSVNAVGYVNLRLSPGLSLIANPLYGTNNNLGLWMPSAPDGSQAYKLTKPDNTYEVSTFDGIAQAWSNPNLQIPIGEGFFFQNNSDTDLMYIFVGEVMQGCLTNSLPEGYSLKGPLVPQATTLTEHRVPGEIGDEVRIYTNDLQGGGSYDVSVYTADGWTPDLTVKLGQGLLIYKQDAQDWVRCFWVN